MSCRSGRSPIRFFDLILNNALALRASHQNISGHYINLEYILNKTFEQMKDKLKEPAVKMNSIRSTTSAQLVAPSPFVPRLQLLTHPSPKKARMPNFFTWFPEITFPANLNRLISVGDTGVVFRCSRPLPHAVIYPPTRVMISTSYAE